MLGCHGQRILKGQCPAWECARESPRCSPCEPDKSQQLVCGAWDTQHQPDTEAEQAAELVMTKGVISRHMVTHTAPLSLSRHAEKNPEPDTDRSQETLQVHSSHPSPKGSKK